MRAHAHVESSTTIELWCLLAAADEWRRGEFASKDSLQEDAYKFLKFVEDDIRAGFVLCYLSLYLRSTRFAVEKHK